MKSYKEMTWEELDECANAIREELVRMDDDAQLWESRGISQEAGFYERVKELELELDYIFALKRGLEDKA